MKEESIKLHSELTSLKQSFQDLQSVEPYIPDPEIDVDTSACPKIGDSILRDFDDNTFENMCVKSIRSATVAGVYKDLEKGQDLHTFKNIIIHAGTMFFLEMST